ncbi:hypothetical protein V6N11_029198 [Hibiscus sabdariffa]|uniref:Isopenicillin N synthase-like Fe(2+) 2OG dioxygenase domain-containing protein n=1 Tax=Hibiscus sabdariffa TaxID=183260 RepID=A0ABR1ZGI6_9ROSI
MSSMEGKKSECSDNSFTGVMTLTKMRTSLAAATEFFNLSLEEKITLLSDNVHNPVRDKMGNYAEAVQALQKQLMEVIVETLGLNFGTLHNEIEEGSQVMAINCYPACPEPDLTLEWLRAIASGQEQELALCSIVEGAFIVQLGDQIQVMSNGKYKSVVHQVTLSAEKKRLSIASLHSLPLNKKIGPAPELVDEQHPASYKEFSFRDFLDYISSNNNADGRFIDSIKKSA